MQRIRLNENKKNDRSVILGVPSPLKYCTIHGKKRCHSLQEVGFLPVGPRKLSRERDEAPTVAEVLGSSSAGPSLKTSFSVSNSPHVAL
ncbi:hypothetical protein TNCV_2857371 [Trichonephila clavipes]|nr:hypothetical protein TNCV_2857371 [Trichonephila clavipes]